MLVLKDDDLTLSGQCVEVRLRCAEPFDFDLEEPTVASLRGCCCRERALAVERADLVVVESGEGYVMRV